jgi:hypothetical protein
MYAVDVHKLSILIMLENMNLYGRCAWIIDLDKRYYTD